MKKIDLGGKWQARELPEGRWFGAEVPGNIYSDLLRAGKIGNPYADRNEKDLFPLEEKDFAYRKIFEVPAEILARSRQELVFECLDTVCDVFLNGEKIGSARNMFHPWRFPVTRKLKSGRNELLVVFRSPVKYGKKQARKVPYPIPGGEEMAFRRQRWRNFVRKSQCSYGWDWGPCLPGVGILGPVRLEAGDGFSLDEFSVIQKSRGGSFSLNLRLFVRTPRPSSARLRLSVGNEVFEKRLRLEKGENRLQTTFRIGRPKLWFPAGYGDQHLYPARLVFLPEGGRAETRSFRIGFRTVELERRRDREGEGFLFRINGVPVFCKGANWIPAEAVLPHLKPKTYRRLLAYAREVDMNMLRVWGGGIYEKELFYDLADELGIMVWQDFMFACAGYPLEEDFLDEVAREAEYQVRRLSPHPSVCLWCGDNENEWGIAEWWQEDDPRVRRILRKNYYRLTDFLGEIAKKEDSSRPYWRSSPSSGDPDIHPNDPRRGDIHYWEVWHLGKPFDAYREIKPRFASEFGFQAFPNPETLKKYVSKEELNPTSPTMEHHQRSGDGNAKIYSYLLNLFRVPRDFDSFCEVSQILQGIGIQSAVEAWRRLTPHCMGILYWQLNDCWPVVSWASVDYELRWKALHYFARRFFSPLLASLAPEGDGGELHLTNETLKPLNVRWEFTLKGLNGKTLARKRGVSRVGPQASVRAAAFRLSRLAPGADPESIYMKFTARAGGFKSEGFHFFVPFKRLDLPKARIAVKVGRKTVERKVPGLGIFEAVPVTVKASDLALFVDLKVARPAGFFTDNFFHLEKGEEKRILFIAESKADPERVRRALRVASLRDTY